MAGSNEQTEFEVDALRESAAADAAMEPCASADADTADTPEAAQGLNLQFPRRQPSGTNICVPNVLGAQIRMATGVKVSYSAVGKGTPALQFSNAAGSNTPLGVHPYSVAGTLGNKPVTVTGKIRIEKADAVPTNTAGVIYGRYRGDTRTSGHAVLRHGNDEPGMIRNGLKPGVSKNDAWHPNATRLEANVPGGYTVKVEKVITLVPGTTRIIRNK